MTTAVALPEKVTAEAHEVVRVASAIVINDDITYAEAGEFQRSAKQMRQKIADFFAPLKKAAHETHKALTAAEKKEIDPIDTALQDVQRKMGAYQIECERQRREEEAILKAQAVEAAKQEALETAEYAEFMGNDTAAQAIRATADSNAQLAAHTVSVEKYAPKVDGQAARTNWKFEIVDASLLPREYLMPDERAIGAIVRARKGAVNIAGVRVFSDTKVTVKA